MDKFTGALMGAFGWIVGSWIGSCIADPIIESQKLEVCNKTCYPVQAITCDTLFTECSDKQIKKIIKEE